MKRVSVDHMPFKGHEDVIKEVTKRRNIFQKILGFLNAEIEIPVAGIAVSIVCWLAVFGMTLTSDNNSPDYQIVVIQEGSQYEVY